MKHQTATGSSNDGVEVATNGSHISQVTDNLHEPQQTDKTSPILVSAGKNESRVMETSSKKKTSPTDSNHTLDSTSTKNVITLHIFCFCMTYLNFHSADI